jgi:predicted nucleotidyltransferase
VAALRGYEWVASDADVAVITLAEWFANVHRDREKVREPFKFPRPWPDADAAPQVTAEELTELTEKLLARSALRDR